MDIYELIKDAIINKKQVYADYDGYPRELCPHVLGTKNGVPQALFYQFGGSSSRGLKGDRSDWKCMILQKMKPPRGKPRGITSGYCQYLFTQNNRSC